MRRRTVLKAIGFGFGGAVALGGGGFGVYFAAAKRDTVGKVAFDNALSIPAVAVPESGESRARVFTLDLRSGETRFKDGPATRTWGVNGGFLGPTIRIRRGDRVPSPCTTA